MAADIARLADLMGQVRTDIAVIKHDVAQIPDLERRVRSNERKLWTMAGIGAAILAAFGIVRP